MTSKATDTDRSDLMVLALPNCAYCHGTAMSDLDTVCKCVNRRVFRIVLSKFHEIEFAAHLVRPMRVDGLGKGARNLSTSYVRKYEEFTADVYLLANRTLTDPIDWAVFRFFHLQGADWKLCAQRLGIDKGTVFHAVYRIEHKLGKLFREVQPYPLYPMDAYFCPTTRVVDVRPFRVPEPKPNGKPLVPPLAKWQPAPFEPEPEPAPAPAPEPVPAPVIVIWDAPTIKAHVRALWRDGKTSRAISDSMRRMAVPAPSGKWTSMAVRKLLMAA